MTDEKTSSKAAMYDPLKLIKNAELPKHEDVTDNATVA
jgi:hypothetical protein